MHAAEDMPSVEDKQRSQRHFGLNSKMRPHIKPFLKIFWSQLKDLMLVIFLLFAFVQTAMGLFYADFERGIAEGSSIFLAVFIVTLGSSIAKYWMAALFREKSMEVMDNQMIDVEVSN
jgi:cell division protein FtsL